MKLIISYIENNISSKEQNNEVLYVSTSTQAKNRKNHLYVKKSHRNEKDFLLASQSLVLFLLEHPEFTSLHFNDHYEIAYYLAFYKNLLKIETITFNQHYTSLFKQNNFLSKKIIEEAKMYIEKNLVFSFSAKDNNKRSFSPTIIMTTFNRTNELEESLHALANQTNKNFELIVVNDGSSSAEALETHKKMKKLFFNENANWTWIDQKNTYLGEARNNGAQRAKGNCLIFLDDDNVPAENMVELYEFHWNNFDYKIFTSCFKIFKEDDSTVDFEWAPFPTPLFTHTLINIFSDAQCLICKETFKMLGQYTTDKGIGYEDWELFNKSFLNDIAIFPIAHSLYSYRIHKENFSMRSSTNDYANAQRALRPFTERFPRLRNAFLINVAIHSSQAK